ncbi:signal peptidase II [Desulfolucanica intricata]|uniref:signal peptidase II n=1 Tax=Desulfolucanica intricata TaxID=1285191 RepID=UPI0008376626|nr:signal peptidase II [Desulfolucanica intricata]
MRFWLTILFVLIVDQGSKYILRLNMYRGESIPLLPPIFYLTYIENPGAAFGMLAHHTNFFIITTIIVILVVLLFYRKINQSNTMVRMGLGLIMGGAIGNLIDRIRIGRVIDFLDFRIWPVFNIADTAIVIGVGLLILDLLHNPEKRGQDYSKVVKHEE